MISNFFNYINTYFSVNPSNESKDSEKDFLNACQAGNLDVVKQFLNTNKDCIDMCKHWTVPLHFAIRGNQPEVIKFLLENGANVNTKDSTGSSSLKIAAEKENLEIIEIILKQKPDFERSHSDGYNSRDSAILTGNVDIVKLFLKYGADFTIKADKLDDHTYLELGIRTGEPKMVQLLIDSGASKEMDYRYANGTLLHVAVSLEIVNGINPEEIIKILLKAGIDPDNKNWQNQTPEQYAHSIGALKAKIALISN